MVTVARLGGYRLPERIGAGGTAMVRLAADARGREMAPAEPRPEFAGDPDAPGAPIRLAPEPIEGGAVTAAVNVFCGTATVAFAATGPPPSGIGPPQGVCFRILPGTADLHGVPEPPASPQRPAPGRDPDAWPPAAGPASVPAGWGVEPTFARTG
jgi:hypothetical protein